MNTSPAQLNPASPVQASSGAGKSQDSAPDTPFSQVLTSEMAQNRRGAEASKGEKPDADTEVKEAKEAVDSAIGGDSPADKTDAIQIAATFDMLRTEALPASPEAFIALAMPPVLSRTGTASPDEIASEEPATLAANLLAGNGSQRGLPSKALQTAQPDSDVSESPKTDSAQIGSVSKRSYETVSAQSARPAAEFAGQLAATRQSDSTKTGEQLSELMANPLMRATPNAPAETSTPTSGAAAYRLAPSVGTTAWGQALGEKMVWMAAGAQQTASLTLNPPNLGPLQIVLNISNDQATASFFSAQPEVRQALESAFPRLREMMNEAGIQLGQATVSADTPQQQAFDQRPQRINPPFPGFDEPAPGNLQTIQVPVMRSGRGLIDTFA